MRWIPKTMRRWGIPIFFAGAIVLAISCAVLIKQHELTLWELAHPGQDKGVTDVYSRWLEISPRARESKDYVLAWLRGLSYQAVRGLPQHPGEFFADAATLWIYTRGFRYPDRNEPALLIRTDFDKAGLARIQLGQHGDLVGSYRLEPQRLIQWAVSPIQLRQQVPLPELPPQVPAAVIAVEDKRFYQHGALDGIGLARALWADVRHQELRQGGSTITQQFSRSVFLSNRRTVQRKVLETLLAFYLEHRYSKNQLLEMYLNQVYWGQDNGQALLGIEAASQSLFGKSARRLSVAESALLAGLLQSPNRYSPRRSPAAGRARRDTVLALMRDQKLLTEERYRQAKAEKIVVAPEKGLENEAAYFLASLQDDLESRYTLSVVLTAGWKIFTTLDPVLQHAAVGALHPRVGEGALVALDPTNGAVRAWVGGTGYLKTPFDRVLYARRQPGSAFKPFVTLAALESRKFHAATLLQDLPLSVRIGDHRWEPQNYDHKYRGQVLLWDALVHSFNVPMVRLGTLVGLPRVADMAQRCGITSPLRVVPSLPLGTSEVSVLELTGAYATFADAGIYHEPYRIESIVSQEGTLVESNAPRSRSAVSAECAAVLTAFLRGVLTEGTAKAARAMGLTIPAAGKTGTSENYQDAWFVGYTPSLVCGVWVGYDIPKSLGSSAAGIALPIWTHFMKEAGKLGPAKDFSEAGVQWQMVDPETGNLARSGCPQRRRLPFLADAQPPLCPKHQGGIIGFFKKLFS